jgi:hypothetical protein
MAPRLISEVSDGGLSKIKFFRFHRTCGGHGEIAQMLERMFHLHEVRGSYPRLATTENQSLIKSTICK